MACSPSRCLLLSGRMEETVMIIAVSIMVVGVFHQFAMIKAQNSAIDNDAENAIDLPQIEWSADEIVLGYRETWNVKCKCQKAIVWRPFDAEYYWGPPNITISIYDTKDINMPYGSMLTITNASALMVGRYYCVYFEKQHEDLDEMIAENVASSIYVYVEDPYQFVVLDPVRYFSNRVGIVVLCKPTYPDVELELCDHITQHCLATSDPTKWLFLPNRNYVNFADFYCKANGINYSAYPEEISKYGLPKPTIVSNVGDYVPIGKTVLLTCNFESPVDRNIQLSWKTLPNYQPAELDNSVAVREYNSSILEDTYPRYIYKSDLIVKNATLAHQRTYRCEVLDNENNTSYHNFRLHVRETPDDFIILRESQNRKVINRRINENEEMMPIEIMVRYKSYPTNVAFTWSREIVGNIEENRNLILREELTADYIRLRINQPTVYHTDNYTLTVNAGEATAIYNITIIIHHKPSLRVDNIMAVRGEDVDILCKSAAYATPEMWLMFQPCNEVPWGNCSTVNDIETEWQAGTQEKNSLILSTMSYKHTANEPGIIYCKGNNSEGIVKTQAYLLLENVSNLTSLEITQAKESITVGDNVTFICSAIIIDGDNDIDITFKHNGMNQESIKTYSDAKILRKQLTLLNVGLHHTGDIDCYVKYSHFESGNDTSSININVIDAIAPRLRSGAMNQIILADALVPIELQCDVFGAPEPKITWFKDGKPFAYSKDNPINTTSITIPYATPTHSGLYECIAENKMGHIKISRNVTIIQSRSPSTTFMNQPYLYVAVVFIILAIIFVFVSLCLYKKLKRPIGNSNLINGYVRMQPMLEASERA